MSLALTLWRPWARFVANGDKPLSNRPWTPPPALLGQRIWIHAGKAYDREAEPFIARVTKLDDETLGFLDPTAHPLGIIGSARLVGWCGHVTRDGGGAGGLIMHRSIAGVTLKPEHTRWFIGPYGWLFDHAVALQKPVKCNGAQKLWTVPADVEEQLTRAA